MYPGIAQCNVSASQNQSPASLPSPSASRINLSLIIHLHFIPPSSPLSDPLVAFSLWLILPPLFSHFFFSAHMFCSTFSHFCLSSPTFLILLFCFTPSRSSILQYYFSFQVLSLFLSPTCCLHNLSITLLNF